LALAALALVVFGAYDSYPPTQPNLTGSYHKRQILNPPTSLPPMSKTAKFQIRQRRYQPNLT